MLVFDCECWWLLWIGLVNLMVNTGVYWRICWGTCCLIENAGVLWIELVFIMDVGVYERMLI